MDTFLFLDVMNFCLFDPSVVAGSLVTMSRGRRCVRGRAPSHAAASVAEGDRVDDFASASSKGRKKIIKPDWIGGDEAIPRSTN